MVVVVVVVVEVVLDVVVVFVLVVVEKLAAVNEMLSIAMIPRPEPGTTSKNKIEVSLDTGTCMLCHSEPWFPFWAHNWATPL